MPNQLWQMDFKSDFSTGDDTRVYPLTVLDDHCRLSLALCACREQKGTQRVRDQLIRSFRRYGLPDRMLLESGPPWRAPYTTDREDPPHYTQVTVWQTRLGVKVSHSRSFRSRTLGKDEYFHRTIEAAILRYGHFQVLPETQARFD